MLHPLFSPKIRSTVWRNNDDHKGDAARPMILRFPEIDLLLARHAVVYELRKFGSYAIGKSLRRA